MNVEQVRFIEELAANAWRPEIEQHLGGWRLRYSGGNSRRVNSVWPNRLPGLQSLQESMEMVEDFYRRRAVPPSFQLCPAMLPEDLPQHLEQRGYTFYARTAVQVQTIPRLLSSTLPHTGSAVATPDLTEEWFRFYTSASGYSQKSLPVRRGILCRIGPPAQFILLEQEGVPVAAGLGVLERGWLGVFCVVTAPQFRRSGHAVAVMHGLARWGEAHGAEQVYLQVMEDNQPGLNLYYKLGFTLLYHYYYAEKEFQNEKID